ncbi:alanine racemase [Pseudonocardia endophytica]|uniref:alanine racemase n=1 Tax=Pseudonocardia endophytica TaxID=401976 RepID=UPI001FB32758|nr:alanine racemase [Pseudonocardia endophytica]
MSEDLDTPFLAVDPTALERNLAAGAARAASRGLAWRPHAKTHKCVEIARRQLAHGAVGLTLATVAEAEVFADAGFDDLFLAYPVWAGGPRADRLRALASRVRLRIGVDSVEGATALAAALRGAPAEVLVEVDSGHHRTGVAPPEAGAVAAACTGLDVVGVFTFPGHSYSPSPGGRGAAADDEAEALSDAAASLAAIGIEPRVRSGGSSPTEPLPPGPATYPATETRPGVSVFGDAQQVELGAAGFDDVALVAVATVVSVRDGHAVLDAGSKTLGADRPPWTSGFGRLLDHPHATIVALSEHHATVAFGSAHVPPVGSRVRVVPNHVCAAANLASSLVVLDGDRVVDRWAVAARGANT